MRSLTFVAACVLAPVLAGPDAANASFHLIRIVEIFPGAVAEPDAQYVVLQMFADGQNFVNGHPVQLFDSAGTVIATFDFPTNVNNGSNQAKILVATAAAEIFFSVTADFAMTPTLSLFGGKLCFDNIDCVAWGNYGVLDAAVGTPFAAPSGLRQSEAVVRDLGANAILDVSDDSNDCAADFDVGAPSPRNNAGSSGNAPPSTCGDGIVQGLEQCDDGSPTVICDAPCPSTLPFADGFESG